MRNLNYINHFRDENLDMCGLNPKGNGMFLIPRKGNFRGFYQVIATDGAGWDHISVCLLDSNFNFRERTLTWDEMCEIKDIFFKNNETTVEFHPREEDYIDEHPWVLHMWKSTAEAFPIPKKLINDRYTSVQKFAFPRHNGGYNVTLTESPEWKCVNVSLNDNEGKLLKRYPKWDEMCEIKDMFFLPEEAAFQVHSEEESDDYSLDIWKPLKEDFPTPPSILVGTKKKVKK